MVHELRTERLHLRRWVPSDREPFAALNSDPKVMQHFPGVLSREESDALATRIESSFEQKGFGLWAVTVPNLAPFIGFVGLAVPRFEAHFTPCVEIGWRIAAKYWNRGYASEAAQASLKFGFETLPLEEIVSFTVPGNLPSRRVMEKIGMSHDSADDFDHPSLPAGHPLRRHVLYRIARSDAAQQQLNVVGPKSGLRLL
ncbi:MAG TPA: GNAT family N-acetyltransferase [Pyrinomonadaceae bacterium]|nr:GNAT family N-acetyltransferase [Pyrinomonadaceae bacterium]